MTKMDVKDLNGFFAELKEIKNCEELKIQAEKCSGCLATLQKQLDENLKTREKLLSYPTVLCKSRPLIKNYEDNLTSTNDILIQMKEAISSYLERDSKYRKAFQELYEQFEKGEYKTE